MWLLKLPDHLHPVRLRQMSIFPQTQDQVDRRRQLIAITEDGQKIINDHTDEATQIVLDFQNRLGSKDYEQLLNLLARLDPGKTD